MFGALFLFFLFHVASAQNSFVVDEECLNYTIYPLQYDVTIKPYIYNGRSFYDCDVTITVIANTLTNIIELEAKDMIINGESIQVLKGNHDIVNRPRPYNFDEERGKLTIYLYEPLIPYKGKNTQHYDIRISFRKEVKLDSYGVFLVKYIEENRQTKYMLQTRLSPDHAKYFIPCFSHPRFDSKFKFAVHIPPANIGVYNTSLVVSEQFKQDILPDNTLVVTYVPSPQVYLSQIGFHYSQFSSVRLVSQHTNDTIVIWAPDYQLKNCYYMLNYGGSLLELIRGYAKVDRSLTTGPINIVAVPKDLNGYEIGSWNLLTNNEIRIVNHPQYTSVGQSEQMHFELTQQLSRIWLGNPGEVDRTKWREEWFKEGVATYLAYYFMTQFDFNQRPQKQRLPLRYYGLEMKHAAMSQDWLQSTPALMTFNNELMTNIPARYRGLVAVKTASLLWMLENYVGTERFHYALVKYINNRRGMYISLKDFMVSLDQDTVECFTGHNGSRASVVLDSWLKHPGYPVVHVRVFRNRNPNVIQLKQWRFTPSGHHRQSNYLIPVSYAVQNTSNCYNCYQPWFTVDSHAYTFEENLNGGWILLNRNTSGYYRVNYDEWTWILISKTLKEDMLLIDELNRAQIVNDVFALYISGDISQGLAMRIMDYLEHETSLMVWESVASGYEMLMIENADCAMTKNTYIEWQTFIRKKIVSIYKELIHSKEQHRYSRLFRSKVIELACAVAYQKCLDYTEHLYRQWRTRNHRIDPDSRRACYYVSYKTRETSLYGDNYNAYEMDDRKFAIEAVRKENHFLYDIPVGEPRPENMTMTTFDPDPNTVSTEKSALTGSGTKQNLSIFVILTTAITVCCMFLFI